MKVVIDDCRLERMDVYTDPLNDKIKRQAAEITRLLAENAELKKDLECYYTGTDICDIESARAAGQEEAWELARKILSNTEHGGYGTSELLEIFGTMMLTNILTLTYDEAAAKVAEWERMNEEICVGDIVRFRENHNEEFCVTDIYDDRLLYGINAEGGVYSYRDIELFEKTGRHIDIKSMLSQIGGGNDD